MKTEQWPSYLLRVALAMALLSPSSVAGEGDVDSSSSPLRFSLPGAKAEAEPVWVSLEEVSPQGTEKAEVNWRLLAEHDRGLLRNYFQEVERQRFQGDTSPCGLIMGSTIAEHYEPNGSLVELARSALAIHRGRVAGIIPGFYRGQPGSLLEIEVEETLKQSVEGGPSHDVLYLHYPVSEFEVGGQKVCRADERFPPLPAAGEDALLFILRDAQDDSHRLLVPEPTEVVFGGHRGKLSYAPKLATDLDFRVSENFEDLLQILLDELSVENERPE